MFVTGKNISRRLKFGSSLCVLLFLLGCSSPSLKVQLEAQSQLNQDVQGDSYSVLVRFYQLTDPAIFEKASKSSLFNEDESLLGVTLVGKEELMVSPGLATELNMPKVDETRYLGVVAFYRDASSKNQMAVAKVKSGKLAKTTKLDLLLNKNELFLTYQ
ncbi:type VI secretion system lipoprotein TssJ [Reinekea marinisedimentorum]|uniref:Type VI secretion system protein VasD n=1 Tax=Reinekea marinisedimentorum TaxID=230495 RepID=A0A4R3I5K9_9GAMM|nr:type VI secretion system lipoprotein TssJ [Reinekea marinisedimentorum]TCS41288.1 type VI secretion system protein VasD [Reinekea marinisedimentorum]